METEKLKIFIFTITVIFLLLLIFEGIIPALIFSGIISFFIIGFIIYFIYIKKSKMNNKVIENFTENKLVDPFPKKLYNNKKIETNFYHNKNLLKNNCNDDNYKILNFDQSFVSKNKALVGNQNPKTLIPPIITPKICDLEHWRDDETVIDSRINDSRKSDILDSGFTPTYECKKNLYENYENIEDPIQDTQIIDYKDLVNDQNYNRNRLELNRLNYNSSNQNYSQYTGENLNQYCSSNNNKYIENLNSHGVNYSSGYDLRNYEDYSIPNNANISTMYKNKNMKDYNENLFTNTITPGLYMKNEIIDSVNHSNLGISLNEDMRNYSRINSTYIKRDPNTYTPGKIMEDNTITQSDIYDPRNTGYGDNSRYYLDKMTGQPRFFYDDINTINMPNYITRSNVDFLNFTDKYGPQINRNPIGNVREQVEQSWVDNNIQFREELQSRLLNKFNARYIQQRQAPIRTNGNLRKRY